ncbi:MAG: 1-acyl-sn-glycerol-3-phosphate acyltransferase [Brevinematales bacterium]|nr:1-acyl-sn-glycerol-3-phosphate acyltransferase [Brevinematales bacterium]
MKRLIGFLHLVIANALSYTLSLPLTIGLTLIAFVLATFGRGKSILTITRIWAKLLFLFALRPIKVVGKEHIDFTKPYLILMNHASMFDIPLLYAVYPGKIQWISKESIFSIPLWGRIMRQLGCISMEREKLKSAKASLEKAIQGDRNASIAMFPEGTRTPNGELQRFKRGFVYIFRNTAYDILPITFNGLFSFCPKHRFAVDPRQAIEVIFHPPLKRETLLQKTDDEILDIVRQHIARDYRGTPCSS